MRAFLAVASAVLILPGLARADAASDEIVKKAIAAQGGEAHLKKMQAMTWKSKGHMEFMGMKMDFTADYAMQLPDKFRFVAEMKIGDQPVKITVIGNGDDAWESALGMTREMEKEKKVEFKHTIYTMSLSMLIGLKDQGVTLTSLGESKDGNQTLAGIKVTKQGQREVRLFFDTKTWFVAKSETKAISEFTMKEVDQTVRFEEYYKKDGEIFFKKIVILQDGKPFITEEMIDPKAHDKLDAKLFQKPQ
jgi:hypothetical protein